MSSTIDTRIVDMEFNNQQFESGVQTSLKSLDSLKKGLNLEDSARSLTNLSNAGRNFSLSGVTYGVQSAANSFSVLGAIGFTVLQNLTNSAINLGKQLTTSLLGINQIRGGFAEYESSLSAFQTIIANTKSSGATIDDVNNAMAKLNLYANQTIYSYGDMTKAAGLFTAQGVNLKDTITGIKGIFNIVSLTGGDAMKANSAIYQLSQAIASGVVRAQDWISVVNAGFGGTDFQNQLIQTAKVHKVAVDQMIKKEGSFRESLQRGWLTKDILLETLSQYTGDLNEAQLKSLGYTKEQIAQIQELGKRANDSATKLKSFTQVKDMILSNIVTGWATTFKLVIGDLEESYVLWSEIGEAMNNVFQSSADARNSMVKEWKDFGGRAVVIDILRMSFRGLLSVMAPIKAAFREIFPPISVQQIIIMTRRIREFARHFMISGKTVENVKKVFLGIFSAFDIVRRAIMAVIGHLDIFTNKAGGVGKVLGDMALKAADWLIKLRETIIANDTFNKSIDKFIIWLKEARDKIVDWAETANKYIQKVIAFLTTAKNKIVEFAKAVKSAFETVKGWFTSSFDTANAGPIIEFLSKIGARFKQIGGLGAIVSAAFHAIGKAINFVAPLFFKMAGIIATFFAKVQTALSKKLGTLDFSAMFDSLKKAVDGLDYDKMFDGINAGLLASVLLAIRSFVTKGGSSIDKVTGIFDGFKGVLGGVQGVLAGVKDSLKSWQEQLKAKTLMTIAIAIAILAASLIALSLVDSAKLTASILAITVMFADLMGAMSIYEKFTDTADTVKGATGLLVIAIALAAMAGAVAIIARLNLEEVKNGLIGLGGVLAEIAIFMKVTDLSGMGIKQSVGLAIMAMSLGLLASAVSKFGKMDSGAMMQGLMTIGVILAEVSAFANTSGNAQNVVKTSIALVILGAGMMVFSIAIERLAKLSWNEIGQGLTVMAGALAIMYGAVALASPKDMLLTAVGLGIMSASMILMSVALKKMGSMSWEEVAVGLVALAGSMAVLAGGLALMQGSIAGAAALLVAVAALNLFVPVLKTLGSMSLVQIGTGLLALAAAFVVIGVAGALLTPVAPALLILGASVALFGLAMVAAGAGIMAFSIALTTFAAIGTAGIAAVGAVLVALGGLIPIVVKMVVGGIVQFAVEIAKAAPQIAKALRDTLMIMIKTIVEVAPAIIDAGVLLILKLLDAIQKTVPKLIETVMVLINAFIDTLVANTPKFIQAGFNVLMAFLNGIKNNIGKVVSTAIQIMTNFLNGIAGQIGSVIQAGYNVIVAFIDGLASAIDSNHDRLNAAVLKLAGAIIDGLVDGILAGVGAVYEAVVKLVAGAIDAFTGKDGLDAQSPSKVTTRIGEDAAQGLANGISNLAGSVRDASESVAKEAVDGMSRAVATISKSLDGKFEATPTIRPVLDLSDVIAGREKIDDLMGSKGVELSATLGKITDISRQMVPAYQSSYGSDNLTSGESKVPTISLTQNNYSPKALDRIEIYRQTRNQLATLKGLVNKA